MAPGGQSSSVAPRQSLLLFYYRDTAGTIRLSRISLPEGVLPGTSLIWHNTSSRRSISRRRLKRVLMILTIILLEI